MPRKNDWHHDTCGCGLCEADRAHLAEEIEVSSLADLAVLTQPPRRPFQMTLPQATSLFAGIGLIGLAIFKLSTGDATGAVATLLAGLTSLHVNAHISLSATDAHT